MTAGSVADAPSKADLACAYALAARSLPTAEQWTNAVRARNDGSSCQGVFAILHELRTEWLGRVGDLASTDAAGSARVQDAFIGGISASFQDFATAYELAIEHLPRDEDWRRALSRREDGTSAEGVDAGLAAVKRELHTRLGELQATACPLARALERREQDA